jgi:hypothetical protein
VSQLKLFNVLENKSLVTHAQSRDTYFLPDFFDVESPTVQYTRLERNASGDSKIPYTIVVPGAYQVKMGLFLASASTQLAFQDTFLDDSGTSSKIAQLTYDSVAIATALTGVSSVACYFEIQIIESNGDKLVSFRSNATLRKALITSAAVTVPIGEVGASQGWAKSVFVPRDGSDPLNPCDGFIILSRPSAIPILVYFDDNGQIHIEPQN